MFTRLWSELADMAGGFGSSGTARQDVTFWSEMVMRSPGIPLSLLVHVPSCVRGFGKQGMLCKLQGMDSGHCHQRYPARYVPVKRAVPPVGAAVTTKGWGWTVEARTMARVHQILFSLSLLTGYPVKYSQAISVCFF